MSALACNQANMVDQHFGGGLSVESEARMREHLESCASCRTAYERHLLFEKLNPSAMSAQDRLARGLGFRAEKPTWLTFSPAIPVGLAALAATLVLVARPAVTRSGDGFSPRGASTAPPSVELKIYQVHAGHSEPVGATIPPEPELAFAYANRSEKQYVMIFGVDEHRHVVWFYPSWTDPTANPSAIPAPASVTLQELPEAVTQKLDGTSLHVEALFLDRPLTVKQVEAQIAASGPSPQIQGALEWKTDLQVAAP